MIQITSNIFLELFVKIFEGSDSLNLGDINYNKTVNYF